MLHKYNDSIKMNLLRLVSTTSMDAFVLVALLRTVCFYAPGEGHDSTITACSLMMYLSAASQVVLEDTVILHPVQPASGLSACPGQDVTINCTIVRMTNIPNVVPPPLQWQYRGDLIVYNDPSHISVYYTVVSHVVGLTVMSNATINSVQISDHDNNITCRSQISTIHSETITLAGNEVSIKNKYLLQIVIIIIIILLLLKLLRCI